MNNRDDSEPIRDQESAEPPPPPIPPQNETVLPDAEENPTNDRIHITMNVPRDTRTIEWLQLAISAALAVIGVFAICIYGGQLNVMKGQLGEMIKQYPELKKSADAAKEAADTAKNTLESSERSFKQEERAYLWASSFNMSTGPICPDSKGIHVCADVHIVNSGRTPANGVHIHRRATFGPNAERTVRAMKVPEYTAPSGDMLGMTGDKWGTAFTDPVDETTARALVDGKIPLYVYGVVQYFDVFGEYHETGFCSHRVLNNTPFISCGDFGNWFDKNPEQASQQQKK